MCPHCCNSLQTSADPECLVKLSDVAVDAVGQVSAGAYKFVGRLQIVARVLLGDPTHDANDDAKGVLRVAFALDEAAAQAKLQRAVSLQQSMPVTHGLLWLREDTLQRVVAKPMVDFDEFDQPSLACFQVQCRKIVPPQELQFWRQRWQRGAARSLTHGSLPEFLQLTPHSRTKRLRDELALPSNVAAAGMGPP